MRLLEELKDRRDRQEQALDKIAQDIKEREEYRLELEQELDDIDRAIAALEPAPYGATREQVAAFKARYSGFQAGPDAALTPAPEVTETQESTAEVEIETTESEPDPVLRAFEDDQIVEREHFEHEHFPMIDAQTCEAVDPRVSWDAEPGPHAEDASVFADDPTPDGYAPVTNPEADAIAGAHDYYSPEAQAAREREESFLNRFNPFRVKADA